jgi:hypothetical protein
MVGKSILWLSDYSAWRDVRWRRRTVKKPIVVTIVWSAGDGPRRENALVPVLGNRNWASEVGYGFFSDYGCRTDRLQVLATKGVYNDTSLWRRHCSSGTFVHDR